MEYIIGAIIGGIFVLISLAQSTSISLTHCKTLFCINADKWTNNGHWTSCVDLQGL